VQWTASASSRSGVGQTSPCFFCGLPGGAESPWFPLDLCPLPAACWCLQLNVVYFKVAGLGLMSGNLSIKASYAVESGQRVSIQFLESTLVSKQQADGICMSSPDAATCDCCCVGHVPLLLARPPDIPCFNTVVSAGVRTLGQGAFQLCWC
jgi:hypothetical protein